MLVQLHSGDIKATSSGRNQGATFSVELPLCQLHENATQPPTTVNGVGEALVASSDVTRTHRVLLVEDHQPTCATLIELLTRRRFRVVAASSLQEARELAEQEFFDILISDIGLPDGSGCELMAELRTRRGLVGIALTGYGMLEDIERSREAGFVTHLTKPVSVAALDKALSMLVARVV
jgi:CheY-like chemotaxis protein